MEMDFYGRVQTGCMFAQDGCHWGLCGNDNESSLCKMGDFCGWLSISWLFKNHSAPWN